MRTPVHKTKSKESDKNSSSKTETSNKPASKAKEVGSTDDKVKLESGEYILPILPSSYV